ncbi:hypothetical protein F8C76_00700 [Flagellimonas olearia]|uniref:Uncharacterized protein n=2 Tax=Flagellimonas olearia TaxID=552546 RepID=A0A6I1DX92_9FLAO|nr:hypothetical protein [Allomuricauda olearia]KAB7530073.1 hypothetical protein F8C76_00700 [Allomuricauda olearia]
MPESQFQTVCITFCLLISSLFGPSLRMAGFHGHIKMHDNIGSSFLSKKKEGLTYALKDGLIVKLAQLPLFFIGLSFGKEKNPRKDSNGNERLIAYSNINYLKTFNPISIYGRLTNVMNANQHNIMLRSSGIVTVYSLIELF